MIIIYTIALLYFGMIITRVVPIVAFLINGYSICKFGIH